MRCAVGVQRIAWRRQLDMDGSDACGASGSESLTGSYATDVALSVTL
eukprot:COSAG02_NODE_41488_length_394_cov_0.701695_1_plen_46_part_10